MPLIGLHFHAEWTAIEQFPRGFKLIEFNHFCSVYFTGQNFFARAPYSICPATLKASKTVPLHSANVAALILLCTFSAKSS